MAVALPSPRRSLSHREVAEHLLGAGHSDPLSPDDGRLAYTIVRAIEGTPIRMGAVPSTPEDFDEIRHEHRRLIGIVDADASLRAEAWLQ